MCVCDKTSITNRILIGSSLIIYVGSDKKEITCTGISTQKRFVNVSFEKNIISESKTTIISVHLNEKRWHVLVFFSTCLSFIKT